MLQRFKFPHILTRAAELLTIEQKIFSKMDISATNEHLSVFWPNLYYVCAETSIFEVTEKVLTSPLDSATQIS